MSCEKELTREKRCNGGCAGCSGSSLRGTPEISEIEIAGPRPGVAIAADEVPDK